MQHVKTLIQDILNPENKNLFKQLDTKLYALNDHLDQFILGVKGDDGEIHFLTPKDHFLPQGERNVDLLDSAFRVMNDIQLNTALSKFKKMNAYKTAQFYKFKISNHLPLMNEKDKTVDITDHLIFFIATDF